MKKVFYINCSDFGSTGKVIEDTAALLPKEEWQTVLCVPRLTREHTAFDKIYTTTFQYEQGISYRISRITGNKLGYAPISTNRICKALAEEKPNIVHIHCMNGSLVNFCRLFRYLAVNNIPTVITNHSEYYYTGYCDHAVDCNKWRSQCLNCPQNISLFDRTEQNRMKLMMLLASIPKLVITSVSPWVYSRSTASPLLRGIKQTVVENGVDTQVFKPYTNAADLRNKLGIKSNELVILHTTAFFSDTNEKKGGAYLIRFAEACHGKNIRFVVAGMHSNPLHMPNNIIVLGLVQDQKKLAELYSMADLCVITSERETFGMAVAESLCCGTPVVGFKAGGPESVALKEYSQFTEFGNIDALIQVSLKTWLKCKASYGQSRIASAGAKRYSRERMATAYEEIYQELCNEKQ